MANIILQFLKNIISWLFGKPRNSKTIVKTKDCFNKKSLSYLKNFVVSSDDTDSDNDILSRIDNHKSITKSYYDLVTDFYEFGWGKSFHFAPRAKGETLNESILRHEYYLCLKLGLSEKDLVLDAGCGVMGPARNICRFTGAHIVGLNLHKYQVGRSNRLNSEEAFCHSLRCVEGDFSSTHFEDEQFNHIYSIEAFCHAPDRKPLFREMLRILKPGGKIAFYDWAMTDKYSSKSKVHSELKISIERGNGIANLITIQNIVEDLQNSGFDIMAKEDLSEYSSRTLRGNVIPWSINFSPSFSLRKFPHSNVGRKALNLFLRATEAIRLVPRGTTQIHHVLSEGADALHQAGEAGIFTPMLFVLASKPL